MTAVAASVSLLPPGADRYLNDANPKVVKAISGGCPQLLSYDDWHRFAEWIDDPDTEASEADLALLGLADRWFLLTRLLRRMDVYKFGDKSARWLYARCREVEAAPDDHLDIWAREHYKSTIITFAGLIQEVLRDPEITSCIFSHTRPTSKKFLEQIKVECEQNQPLRQIYPDVIWDEPRRDARPWSLDGGLVFKRKGNPKEATIEAWGLVDGQPTSKHFQLRVYDDVVTLESITTPDMVRKTTKAFEMSDNLGTRGGRRQVIGTRYSYNDSYAVMIEREILTVRRYPATKTGTLDGEPVYLSEEEWRKKKKEQPSTVAPQMLQAPTAGDQTMFDPHWLKAYFVRPLTLNVYIIVDPSKGKNRTSDRCAMAVLGIDTARNKYLLDGYCHRMKLHERWTNLRDLRKKWKRQPGVHNVSVGYEVYGLQTDTEVFEAYMLTEKYHFPIEEVNWVREGQQSKDDRVERLVPDVKNSKFWVPGFVHITGVGRSSWTVIDGAAIFTAAKNLTKPEIRAIGLGEQALIAKPIIRKNEDGEVYDLTRELMDEMFPYPFGKWKDMIDATSRIYDMNPSPPQRFRQEDLEPDAYWD